MKRIRPRLLTAAIRLRLIRSAVRTTTGVRPLGARERPTWSWSETPVSSPQWITARGLGPPGDRRVVPLQPGLDRRGPALPGADQGLPRRHPPAPQVGLHRRQAQALGEPALDQLAHRAAGPQGERQLELVRGLLDDPSPDLVGLLRRQPPFAAPRRHTPAVEDALLAPLAVALHPRVHGLAVDADQPRGPALAQALPLDQEQGPPAQPLLRRSPDAAKVACFHPGDMAPGPRAVRYICGRLVIKLAFGELVPLLNDLCETPHPFSGRQ